MNVIYDVTFVNSTVCLVRQCGLRERLEGRRGGGGVVISPVTLAGLGRATRGVYGPWRGGGDVAGWAAGGGVGGVRYIVVS